MKVLSVSELSSISGGSSFTQIFACLIAAAKAANSGKPLDVGSAAATCAPVIEDVGSAAVDKYRDVKDAFSIRDGQGDISKVGTVVVRDWVDSYGGYSDDGYGCYFPEREHM